MLGYGKVAGFLGGEDNAAGAFFEGGFELKTSATSNQISGHNVLGV